MRGDNLQEGVQVPSNTRSKLIAANIIDPKTGVTQYHIVSTKLLNIVVVSIVTILLCGLVVLSLVMYLKLGMDYNTQKIQELEKGTTVNANTP
jgi:flagellar basal body-associated protein FliL